jgi:hypothetical protein
MQQELASAKDNNSYRTIEDLNLIDDIHDLLVEEDWREEVVIEEPSIDIYHSYNVIEINGASGEANVRLSSGQAESFAIDIVNLINEKITIYEKHKEKDYVAPQVDLEKKND